MVSVFDRVTRTPGNRLADLVASAAENGSTVRLGAGSEPVPLASLWQEAATLGMRLADSGVAPVGVVMAPSSRSVVGFFGALLSGRTVVSLPSAPRGGPDSHLEFLRDVCETARISEILAPDDPELVGALGRSGAGAERYSAGDDATGAEAVAMGSLVQFSSGSIRQPRGVLISWSKVAANIEATLCRLELERDNTTCSWMPLGHDMGLVGLFLTSVCAGSAGFAGRSHTVLFEPEWFTRKPTNWLQFVSQEQVGVTGCPPSLLPLLCRLRSRHGDALDLSPLRHLIVGSEPIVADHLADFDHCYRASGLASHALRPAYGMAELGLTASMTRADSPWRAAEIEPGAGVAPGRRAHVLLGPPLDGYEVTVDAESNRLVVAGPSVFDAYLGSSGTGTTSGSSFTTSDLGTLSDGDVVVFGRADDVVFAGGLNVFLNDIDEAVVASGAVRRGRVQAVARPDGGFAVLVEGSMQLPVEMERLVRELLVRELGVTPAEVKGVRRGTLCFTPSGKPRRALTATLA